MFQRDPQGAVLVPLGMGAKAVNELPARLDVGEAEARPLTAQPPASPILLVERTNANGDILLFFGHPSRFFGLGREFFTFLIGFRGVFF